MEEDVNDAKGETAGNKGGGKKQELGGDRYR